MTEFPVFGLFTPEERARLLAAVPKRRSIRAYRGEIAPEQLDALKAFADRACLPGVRIAFGEGACENLYRKFPFVDAIHGANRYAAIIADMGAPENDVCAGASGEAFILEATALGVGTCWVMAFKRAGVTIPLNPGEKVLAVTPLGLPDEAPDPRPRKKLSDLAMNPLEGWPQWALDAAECVRLAPSAVNMQPWRLSFFGDGIDLFSARKNPGLDMGIAALHLSLGMKSRPHVMRWVESVNIACQLMEERK